MRSEEYGEALKKFKSFMDKFPADRLMSEAGFERWGFAYLPGMWTFFIFNGALARTVRWLERFQMRLPVLRGATSFILGVWRKPEED